DPAAAPRRHLRSAAANRPFLNSESRNVFWPSWHPDLAPLYVKTLPGCRVGFLVAGPGSGLSEEPTSGVRSVTLDCRVVPECPPGPAASRRFWSAIIRA